MTVSRAVRYTAMRGLLRHAFTVCSAISLALCVAVVATWVRTSFGPIHLFQYRYVIEFDHRWELGFCRTSHWCVGYPLWTLVLGTAVLPALRWRAFARLGELRRLGRRRGFCDTCGYDLRAHAKGERCPECGAAVG